MLLVHGARMCAMKMDIKKSKWWNDQWTLKQERERK